MKLTRTEAREKIMTILYQVDLYIKNNMQYSLEEVFNENLEIDNNFVREVVNGVLNNSKEIDDLINKYLGSWDIDRLGKTDKAILRMGVFEIKYYNTPNVVAINEAVELSKKYSDDKVIKVINAVLDKVQDEVSNE